MQSIVNTFKSSFKKWRRHPRTIAFARKILSTFPSLDETLRVLKYRIDKKIRSYKAREFPLEQRKDSGLLFMVDVSHLIRRDVHTGIQRVLRSLLIEFLKLPPEEYEVIPVYVNDKGRLIESRAFAAKMMGQQDPDILDKPVKVRSGDIWFTADTYMEYPAKVLQQLRRHEVKIIFTVYDILPLKFPQFFYRAQRFLFSDWLEMVLKFSDEIVCISKSVSDDLWRHISLNPPHRSSAVSIGHFHLGADITASKPTFGVKRNERDIISKIAGHQILLMVGTLEPRKGHTQVLEAMDYLWSEDKNIVLVIIGKPGWRSQELVKKLQHHREKNQRLFWLSDVSDELLLQYYSVANALVAASYDEGFGLPLIEAAEHGVPIIARDIPVFREVARDHAFYFKGDTKSDMAESFRFWLDLKEKNQIPEVSGLRYLTWKESAQQLKDIIFEHRWDYVWSQQNLEKK